MNVRGKILVLVCLLSYLALTNCRSDSQRRTMKSEIRFRTEQQLIILSMSIYLGDWSEAYPRGGIETVEELMHRIWTDPTEQEAMEILFSRKNGPCKIMVFDHDELRLIDYWGHRVVYQCPADDPTYAFRLYSIGPNGIDEGGKGDDIDASRPMTGNQIQGQIPQLGEKDGSRD